MRESWIRGTFGDAVELAIEREPIIGGREYPTVGVLAYGRGLLYRDPVTMKTTSYKELNRIAGGRLIYSKLKAFEGAITVTPEGLTDSFASGEFPTFKCTGRALPSYLRLVTQHPRLWQAMSASSKGLGGRRERLHPRDFLSLPFTLPPLDDQRRIVDLIRALDHTIDAAKLASETTAVAMRELPAGTLARAAAMGWPECTLAESLGAPGAIRTGPFGSQLHQSDYVTDGPIAVIMPTDMRGGRVDMASAARVSQADADRLRRHMTRVGDILWSRRGDVTRFAVIDYASAGSLCGTGCFLLRPSDPGAASWLEVWLSAPTTEVVKLDEASGSDCQAAGSS